MWWYFLDELEFKSASITLLIILVLLFIGVFTYTKCNKNYQNKQIINDTIKEQVIQYDTVLKNDSILILKVVK
jgi:hypothetical protein